MKLTLPYFFLYLFVPVSFYLGFSAKSFAISDNKSIVQNKLITNLSTIGVTYKRESNNIDILIDQEKSLNSLPILEEQGIISKMDTQVVNKAPLSISAVIIGVSSTLRILNDVFMNTPSLTKIHVNAYVIPIGSASNQLCYSFDYDREAFNKLNLNIVTPRQFVRDTLGFVFSKWCQVKIYAEGKKFSN